MFNIIEEFIGINKNLSLLKYTGAIAGITGLFLNITKPELPEAEKALKNIQLFWLILLTFLLFYLFSSIVKFTWKKEKKILPVYEIPVTGIFSITVATILFGVILSLLDFIAWTYETFATIAVEIGFPISIVTIMILISIYIKKHEDKIPLLFVFMADSLIIGILIAIAGFYIQGVIEKLYYFFWFTEVAPKSAGIFFLLFLTIAYFRKLNLFKPYVSIQR